jgi:hypothetical protein
MHMRRVTITPLMLARLQRVAECVGYTGELFLPEPEEDTVDGVARHIVDLEHQLAKAVTP